MTKITKTIQCDKKMNFSDCELEILKNAVSLAETKKGKRMVNTPEIQEMITIVENFIKKKDLICYGGIAIDALLPEENKIYDKELELSDYDFFSPNAIEDAKELADIYNEKGYEDVEARVGAHVGTYKVFCNFIGTADVTNIPKDLFNTLKKDAVRVNGILYVPPNFLRMSMYLELSRPEGQIDRWSKVFKRLSLINKYYPLTEKQCSTIDFQRELSIKDENHKIYETVKETFINQGVVFFGGYAISNYSKYMPKKEQEQVKKIADFDVLSNDPKTTAEIVKERLHDIGIKNVKIVKRPPIGEIIPEQTEIRVINDVIAVIYPPLGCHSFNTIDMHGKKIKIATIDTMLSFYLAFLYANKPYYDPDRIICMAKFLFDVQQKNRLEQKGLLRRFTITCYGHQEDVIEMREEKTRKFKELKDKKGTREYDVWFLSYNPKEPEKNKSNTQKNKNKKNKNKKSQKKIVNPYNRTKKNKYW